LEPPQNPGRFNTATDLLTVNREFTVSLVLSRCNVLDDGRRRWKVRFDTSLTPDITVAVRLDETNQAALDYYLLPRLDFGQPRIHLAEHNSICQTVGTPAAKLTCSASSNS